MCTAFIRLKYIMKGGDKMIKKIAAATGVFAMSALAAATMTFAQTTTTPSTNTTMTPAPTTSVPAGAPATGRAN
jgi:hypothetical protein